MLPKQKLVTVKVGKIGVIDSVALANPKVLLISQQKMLRQVKPWQSALVGT